MLNKIDVKPFDELSPENKEILTKFQQQENVTFHKEYEFTRKSDTV